MFLVQYNFYMFKRKQKKQSQRTFKGSSPYASVFSYHASRSRSDVATGRGVPQTDSSSKWWRNVPSYVSLVALSICGIYVLTLTTNPKIRLFSDHDSQYLLRDLSTYQDVAKQLMQDSIFNRTKFTINTNKLAQGLHNQFPELGEVSITLPLMGRKPIFELQPIRPALILVARNGSFVIDERGRAVVKTSDVARKSNLSIPTVTDESGLTVDVTKNALPQNTVVFISQIIGYLNAKKINASSLSLPAIANELHVGIDGQPYYIKFNIEEGAREQVGTFLAVKEKLEADKTRPKTYIDVRIEERAYYQ